MNAYELLEKRKREENSDFELVKIAVGIAKAL
jgi:hypothetical protein